MWWIIAFIVAVFIGFGMKGNAGDFTNGQADSYLGGLLAIVGIIIAAAFILPALG